MIARRVVQVITRCVRGGAYQVVRALLDRLPAEEFEQTLVCGPEGAPEGAAHVTIKLDGRTSELDLRPDDVGVLEAALRVRSDLPFACRGGVCGTCRALLVEGEVAMDVNYALEPEEIEKGYVLTCQAHPASEKVVLDYDA
jgi:ring-1,2-phenylacetyl-CoA epoxidase subunit PaaE